VLQELLPEGSAPIKGQMQAVDHLKSCSHLEGPEFHELLHLLDRNLRLITPTTMDGEADHSSKGKLPHTPRYYQLSHDFLVEPLREWLSQKQRSTRQGRATLRLAELTRLWKPHREPRYLPSPLEYLSIALNTRRSLYSADEAELMQIAGRRFLAVAMGVTVAILLMTAGIGAARARAEHDRNQLSAEGIVDQLKSADADELPHLLVTADVASPRISTLLRVLGANESAPRDQRARAHLLLAPRDGDCADAAIEYLLDAPAEDFDAFRKRPWELSTRLSERLWSTVTNGEADAGRLVRAACILAHEASRHEKWNGLEARLAWALTTVAHTEDIWLRHLEPVSSILVQPLSRIAVDPERDDQDRVAAVRILSQYASENAPQLTTLLLQANPEQFRYLIAPLANFRDQAATILQNHLAQKCRLRWPNDETTFDLEPDPTAVTSIQNARGEVKTTFAFCQTLSLNEFAGSAELLSKSGYRPLVVRPWRSGDQTLVAATWARDGRSWRLELDRTPEELIAAQATHAKDGLLIADVAAWRQGATGVPQRYSGVWGERDGIVLDAEFYVDTPEDRHEAAWRRLNDGGFVPRSNFLTSDPTGRHYTSVRWLFESKPNYTDVWDLAFESLPRQNRSGWCQTDVRVDGQPSYAAKPLCSAVWWDGADYESKVVTAKSTDEHLEHGRQLAAEGFRPVSISLDSTVDGAVLAASVWHRPLPRTADLDQLAREQANAAIALLHLDRAGPVWAHMKTREDSRLRSFLIERLFSLKVPAATLANRAMVESDASVRAAILMALGRYPEDALVKSERTELLEWLVNTAKSDPSSEVHSAALHLLRAWNKSKELADFDASVARTIEFPKDREWFVSPEGVEMVVIRDPKEFPMGSPGNDEDRSEQVELLHRRTLDRGFAIASYEVTAELYHRFDPAFRRDATYAPTPDCPVNMITWFEAARFCRLLSEAENIPETEMCYPDVDQIVNGLELRPDWLLRTGYRLPTEAEWEYASRAGTTTSRYYGDSPELLHRYAWTIENAGLADRGRAGGTSAANKKRLHACGRLLPNPFGLFDIYGNGFEWTQTPYYDYPREIDRTFPNEMPPADPVITKETSMVIRGGAFLYIESNARSAQRQKDESNSRQPHNTFRIVRTLPVGNVP
jgi:formylglycine-generating enzyme required for sulfatase activity